MSALADWRSKGFARSPDVRIAGKDGLLMYRCWGGNSKQLGRFFSSTKPTSVSDAELKYNIVDWGNGIRKVSTFRLKPGFSYFIGPVANGPRDLSIWAEQIYVEPPLEIKVEHEQCEVLKQDFTVLMLNKEHEPKPGQERGRA
jgi:hypothetical protein